MRYISEDNKVFNSEQECLEHENLLKRHDKERIRKEKLERERPIRLKAINEKYDELQKLISEYEKDYGLKQVPYFAPFYELLNMLC